MSAVCALPAMPQQRRALDRAGTSLRKRVLGNANRKKRGLPHPSDGFVEHVFATSHPALPGVGFNPFVLFESSTTFIG
jgi:hypothetical protein